MHSESALSAHALTGSPTTGLSEYTKRQCARKDEPRKTHHPLACRSDSEIVVVFPMNDLLALTLNHLYAVAGWSAA